MAYTHGKYVLLKAIALENYKKFGNIHCPYFHEVVLFSDAGLEHLLFKSKHNARSEADQYMRLKFLYLAPAIISLSQTLQDYGAKISQDKIVKYYVFTVVINTISVKVVVREVGKGSKHFFSILPFWRQSTFYVSK